MNTWESFAELSTQYLWLGAIGGWGNAKGALAVVVGALNRVVSRSMTFALLLAFFHLIVFSP